LKSSTALIVGGFSKSLVNFRGALLASMVQAGHRVHAAAPGIWADAEVVNWLRDAGVSGHDFAMARASLNPVKDFRTLWALIRLVREVNPDVVLCYTIKPVIWGLLAASLGSVPRRYALITGLGYVFTGDARGRRALAQRIARCLYRLSLRRATLVFFQNPDDEREFRKLKLVPLEVPSCVVNGSGVDVEQFPVATMPHGPVRFLLIARLLGDKGIREYVAAARVLAEEHPRVEWHLVGGPDPNPDAIGEAEVRGWQDAGFITWRGELKDVRPAIASAHVYVLPSYREGTPRTVLEAMAMGRGVVTVDAPGCRETVVDGDNGFLVPPRDVDSLVRAMRRFLDDPSLIQRMGARSRAIAKDKYDVHKVNAVMLDAMGLSR
jgi:glycosyltransferase involved in cell wall biosynthesis